MLGTSIAKFLLKPSRCVFTKYTKSKFSQNTANLLSIKVATCFDSRSRHQASYKTMFQVHQVKVHFFGIAKYLQLWENVDTNEVYIYNITYILKYIHVFLKKKYSCISNPLCASHGISRGHIYFLLKLFNITVSSRTTSSVININHVQSHTTQLMILLKCIYYIVSFNDMFRL
jgi:hypothetical protein